MCIVRSISSWLDNEGKIRNELLFADIMNIHSDVGKSKKDL